MTLLSFVYVSGVHVQSTELQEDVPKVADGQLLVFRMLSVYMSTTLTDVAPGFDVLTRDNRVRTFVEATRVYASRFYDTIVVRCVTEEHSTRLAAFGVWRDWTKRFNGSEPVVFKTSSKHCLHSSCFSIQKVLIEGLEHDVFVGDVVRVCNESLVLVGVLKEQCVPQEAGQICICTKSGCSSKADSSEPDSIRDGSCQVCSLLHMFV